MPVKGKEIKITNEDLHKRLGQSPAINEQPAHNLENQRILAHISQANDPTELNRIGRAAANRLKELGAAAPAPRTQGKQKKVRMGDRALLHLYLNLSPFILACFLMLPLALWLGNVVPQLPLYLIFGTAAMSLQRTCPPNCSWMHIVMWAAIGGVSLLVSFLASYALRKRLLKAI